MSLVQAVGGALEDIKEGFELAPLWSRLAIDQTVSRYRRTLLGPFWLASSTLAVGVGMALVFGAMFGGNWRQNFPFILSGVVLFTLISGIVTDAAQTFLGASGIMQTRKLPLSFHALLNCDRMLINFAHQIIGFWIVSVVMTLFGVAFAVPHWEFIPNLALVVCVGFLLAFPIGMISTRYRDVNYFVGFVMQMAFMLTPIFWRPSQLPKWLRPIADYNPLAHMLEILRQPLLGHPALGSDLLAVLLTLAISAVLAIFSLALFRRRVVFWL